MIPRAAITAWAGVAPWPLPQQVEQDLVLSRLIVEIARHRDLGEALALRGGTCLNKLVLAQPARYSEDLDYVGVAPLPVGAVFDALRGITDAVGLEERDRSATSSTVRFRCAAPAESGTGEIRVKIEIAVDDPPPFYGCLLLDYAVESPWYSGGARVRTFPIDELVATKLRALYQRRKGRDLFDLWLVLRDDMVDPDRVTAALAHYAQANPLRYAALRENLMGKLDHPAFGSDLAPLVRTTPDAYRPAVAGDLVMERLGALLPGAPPIDAIAGGRWRDRSSDDA